jgi:catechol 2,3-dioxygenase-like lactoylglutathione lyase family enzyme
MEAQAMHSALFILFVQDQQRSASFYRSTLHCEPLLDVPGMTEFPLSSGAVVGLMPEAGMRRLLGSADSAPASAQTPEPPPAPRPGFATGPLPDPASPRDTLRAELYLLVDDPIAFHGRALKAGARELSPPTPRPWGDLAAYSLDPDGYVLAFAKRLSAGN